MRARVAPAWRRPSCDVSEVQIESMGPGDVNPYYEQDGIVIYHADCRDVLPTLEPVDLVLTDPPYNVSAFNGRDNTTIGKIKRADGS